MQGLAVNSMPPVQPAVGIGAKPPAGGGPTGSPQQFPPGFHPGAPPAHGALQPPPGHQYTHNHPDHGGQNVYPGAGPPWLHGGPGPMGGPEGVGLVYLRHSQAVPPDPELRPPGTRGEDLNYMGGMRNVGAMLHAAEAGHVHSSSTGSAEQRNLSLNASSATSTNITKTSWADFQKCASVLLCPGTHSYAGFQLVQRCFSFCINCRAGTTRCALVCLIPVCLLKCLRA